MPHFHILINFFFVVVKFYKNCTFLSFVDLNGLFRCRRPFQYRNSDNLASTVVDVVSLFCCWVASRRQFLLYQPNRVGFSLFLSLCRMCVCVFLLSSGGWFCRRWPLCHVWIISTGIPGDERGVQGACRALQSFGARSMCVSPIASFNAFCFSLFFPILCRLVLFDYFSRVRDCVRVEHLQQLSPSRRFSFKTSESVCRPVSPKPFDPFQDGSLYSLHFRTSCSALPNSSTKGWLVNNYLTWKEKKRVGHSFVIWLFRLFWRNFFEEQTFDIVI